MRITSSVMFVALSALLAGCSETSFMDTLGIGKASPDERLVSSNPPLSVPPDMQLRPPSNAAKAPPARTAAASAPLSNPPAYGSVPPAAPAAPTRAATTTTQTGAPGQDVDARGRPISSFDKVYIKHGIDVYNPDGTHKKTVELNRELAEKIKAEKKARNPNYGTIFNMGSIFKD